MDSFFGKKKSRPRGSSISTGGLEERSVPYNKLGPPPRSPVTVNTVSQGLRGNPTAVISAPITNPGLTATGTEMNKFSQARSRSERERAYREGTGMNPYGNRPGSPSMSVYTADSSTLYNGSDAASMKANARKVRQSGSNASMSDFAIGSPTSPGMRNRTLQPDPITARPSSTLSSNRLSMAPSVASSESHNRHLSHLSQHFFPAVTEEFHMPRPENPEDIEAMFEEVMRERDIPVVPNLTIEQKWHMVQNSESLRFKEARQKEDNMRKQLESGQTTAIIEGSPEWYIKKFMDRTITPKQAGALFISLRSKEIEYDCPSINSCAVSLTRYEVGSSYSLNLEVRLCWHRR